MSRRTWQKLPGQCSLACLVIGSWLAFVGCGRSEKSSAPDGDVPAKNAGSATEGRPSADRDTAEVKPSTGSKKNEESRRYVGDVPLDVWFDDPLAVSKNGAPTGGSAVAGSTPVPIPTVKPEEKSAGNTKPASAPPEKGSPAPPVAAAGDWKSVISGDVIADEAKAIRAHISNSLQTVSKYNGNYKEIQVDAAVLAALAQVAAKHPDSISWKKDARFVRDLAADVGKQAKGLAKTNYDNTKTAFDRLDNLLSGNRPSDLGNAEEKALFSEIAPRAPLMRRMDRSDSWLKSTVNTESILKSSADKAAHEGAMLGFLSKVVASSDYSSADEPEYQKFLETLIKSSQAVAVASKDGDFQAFSDALSRSHKTCNECHSNYRFSSGN